MKSNGCYKIIFTLTRLKQVEFSMKHFRLQNTRRVERRKPTSWCRHNYVFTFTISTTQELEQSQHLLREADNMIGISKCTYGPDTISRISQFNLESVVADFSAYSPELYRFFATIGSSSQHLSTDNLALRVEDTKVITSLCIILNARSNRFRGLQLLIYCLCWWLEERENR